MRKLLELQVSKHQQAAVEEASKVSPEVSLQKASAAVRDAGVKHDQAVAALIKAESVLVRAKEREQEAALTLARAEQAKRIAVKVLAKQDGLLD
eukprot:6219875-Pyramimonas_sp.AAC.1